MAELGTRREGQADKQLLHLYRPNTSRQASLMQSDLRIRAYSARAQCGTTANSLALAVSGQAMPHTTQAFADLPGRLQSADRGM